MSCHKCFGCACYDLAAISIYAGKGWSSSSKKVAAISLSGPAPRGGSGAHTASLVINFRTGTKKLALSLIDRLLVVSCWNRMPMLRKTRSSSSSSSGAKMCKIASCFHQRSPRASLSPSSCKSGNSSALGSDWLQRASSCSWEDMDSTTTTSRSSNQSELTSAPAASPPPDVPEGSVAVYVGSERRRFVVGTRYLGNPLFKALLDKAAEEYGYDRAGALTIPCDAVLFEHVLWLLNNNDPAAARLEMNDLLHFYSS